MWGLNPDFLMARSRSILLAIIPLSWRSGAFSSCSGPVRPFPIISPRFQFLALAVDCGEAECAAILCESWGRFSRRDVWPPVIFSNISAWPIGYFLFKDFPNLSTILLCDSRNLSTSQTLKLYPLGSGFCILPGGGRGRRGGPDTTGRPWAASGRSRIRGRPPCEGAWTCRGRCKSTVPCRSWALIGLGI